MVVALYGDGIAGRFGMTLPQAKEAFLAKVKELGLEPVSIREVENDVTISFYNPRRRTGPPPWGKLRKLANEFSVRYDYDGDPPWEYNLTVEESPPEGQYKPV